VPLQDVDGWRNLAGLGRHELELAVHLVGPDGRVYAGAAAVRPLLGLLPGGRLAAAPLAAPGAGRVAQAVYRWVARHRRRDRGACLAVRRD